MEVSQAYQEALTACRRARDKEKHYVAIQSRKGGGFRLVATDRDTGRSSFSFDMLLTDWASNVVYRLAELNMVDFTPDDVDEYFDRLEATGYDHTTGGSDDGLPV